MIRVLLVDDDPVICRHLEAILLSDPKIRVLGWAHDGPEAVRNAARLEPDVVLLDLRMPGGDGLEAIAPITAEAPECRVVVLTAYDTDRDVATALARGAAGYVLKSSDPAELVHVVHVCASGQQVLSPHVVHHLTGQASSQQTLVTMIRRALTDRELETLRGLAAGLSNVQVAQELGISVATVKGHVSSLVRKLGCESRLQAGLLARDARLDLDRLPKR
ncbi:response regulator transcription factor [Georgenia halophila]|uniref:Response regulator transcription factor n=1 Tax=Georgenia halophila TaxID=620889 RepID=A0ABP8L6K6_9MICO